MEYLDEDFFEKLYRPKEYRGIKLHESTFLCSMVRCSLNKLAGLLFLRGHTIK
jgi:hypothetical protein